MPHLEGLQVIVRPVIKEERQVVACVGLLRRAGTSAQAKRALSHLLHPLLQAFGSVKLGSLNASQQQL